MTHSRPEPISTEQLWRGLRDRLVDFAERRTRSREDAEDIVQDVFLRIHRALDGGASIARPDAFLFRTARNAIVDRYRRAGVRETDPSRPWMSRPKMSARRSRLAWVRS